MGYGEAGERRVFDDREAFVDCLGGERVLQGHQGVTEVLPRSGSKSQEP